MRIKKGVTQIKPYTLHTPAFIEDVKASKLYDEYVQYCEKTRVEAATMKQTGFANKIKSVEGITKQKNRLCNNYTIDWEAVENWLVKKNYWDDDNIIVD